MVGPQSSNKGPTVAQFSKWPPSYDDQPFNLCTRECECMVINKKEFRLNLNEKEETLGKNGSY